MMIMIKNIQNRLLMMDGEQYFNHYRSTKQTLVRESIVKEEFSLIEHRDNLHVYHELKSIVVVEL
jgi:hypothetical protein